jgi:hypothetical protein
VCSQGTRHNNTELACTEAIVDLERGHSRFMQAVSTRLAVSAGSTDRPERPSAPAVDVAVATVQCWLSAEAQDAPGPCASSG